MNLKGWKTKTIGIIIITSLTSCSVTYVKGDSNDVRTKIDNKQKIDSMQLLKNNIKPPKKW